MRLVIQRVSRASVEIAGSIHSEIGTGLMILVGIREGDTIADVDWLVGKTAAMRIFPDDNGVMNRSLLDVDGEALAVSHSPSTPLQRKGTDLATYMPPDMTLRYLYMRHIARNSQRLWANR